MSDQYILGISAYYHDSAAALIEDGHLVGAAQEERFTRKKHDAVFPERAIAYCLARAGITTGRQLDHVVYYEKPLRKLELLLETYIDYAPRGFANGDRPGAAERFQEFPSLGRQHLPKKFRCRKANPC